MKITSSGSLKLVIEQSQGGTIEVDSSEVQSTIHFNEGKKVRVQKRFVMALLKNHPGLLTKNAVLVFHSFLRMRPRVKIRGAVYVFGAAK